MEVLALRPCGFLWLNLPRTTDRFILRFISRGKPIRSEFLV